MGTLSQMGNVNGNINLLNVFDGTHIRTLSGHTLFVTSVAFSPDGNTIASGSADQSIRLWNVSDGSHIRTLSGHTSTVTSVAFSPDGNTIASGSADQTVRFVERIRWHSPTNSTKQGKCL